MSCITRGAKKLLRSTMRESRGGGGGEEFFFSLSADEGIPCCFLFGIYALRLRVDFLPGTQEESQ
jgi:hypothetical protein